jgi:L-2,4-diaminobutyrate decarboxylase
MVLAMSDALSLDQARARLAKAYDPQRFASAAQAVVGLLAEYLRDALSVQGPVLHWRDPQTNMEEAAAALRDATRGAAIDIAGGAGLASSVADLVKLILARGQTLHHPHYIGHQVPPPLPTAALFEWVSALTNQAMAIYEMGPWASAVELAMVDVLGEAIGLPRGQFAGLITSGGSLANLTALLTARNVALPQAWRDGLAPASAASANPGGAAARPVIIAHGESHYSISRAAGVLGLGSGQVVKAPVDAQWRMDPITLDQIIRQQRAQGRAIVAVVACSPSTRTGAFDPLPAIADVCRAHGVWLHADACHGGAACLSERHRHLVAGLELADSIVLDAHKMLHMPALSTFVFYRDKAHRFCAFEQDAPYLFDPAAPGLADYDSGLRTVECTKRAAAFALWGVWALFGRQIFADLVDVTFDMGRRFHAMLAAADDFEPLHEPQCNIVVFRHVPAHLRGADPATLGAFQWELRRRVIESGAYYLVPAKADGFGALRVVITHPFIDENVLAGLLDTLRKAGQS